MGEQLIHVLYLGGRFLSLSNSGRVVISDDGEKHDDATPAELYGILLNYINETEAKQIEAKRPWWCRLLEKLT